MKVSPALLLNGPLAMLLVLSLAVSAHCSAEGKRNAHQVVDRVEAACVVIARSLDPGAEVLCATAAELSDAIIEMTRKRSGPGAVGAMTTPFDPEDATLELFETVKARRAAGAVTEPKKP